MYQVVNNDALLYLLREVAKHDGGRPLGGMPLQELDNNMLDSFVLLFVLESHHVVCGIHDGFHVSKCGWPVCFFVLFLCENPNRMVQTAVGARFNSPSRVDFLLYLYAHALFFTMANSISRCSHQSRCSTLISYECTVCNSCFVDNRLLWCTRKLMVLHSRYIRTSSLSQAPRLRRVNYTTIGEVYTDCSNEEQMR